MNVSIYLPDQLNKRLEQYIKEKGMNRNSAVRKALELLLGDDESKDDWGPVIRNFKGDPDFPRLEDLRKGLKDPPSINLD